MAETCKACHDPLTLTLDPEDSGDDTADQAQTVPDDLLLPCGCHFHWQCLLDQAPAVASSLRCPSCAGYLPDPATAAGGSSSSSSSTASHPPILTTYVSEGGVQPHLDLTPTLLEEAFLASHPHARPARALHTLLAEGEVAGAVDLLVNLHSDDDDEDDDEGDDVEGESGAGPQLTPLQLLSWRDPLNGLRSALHVALEARQEEAVWAVLWLGSGAARDLFPPAVVQVAEGMGLPRWLEGASSNGMEGEDVRIVRDERGRTAGDVCLELGEPWTRLVEGGLFLVG